MTKDKQMVNDILKALDEFVKQNQVFDLDVKTSVTDVIRINIEIQADRKPKEDQ